jgi:glycerophosphoryl diester phosphodiesterase
MVPSLPNAFAAKKNRPIVVGHRGVPTVHQENSLAGFRRAVQLGIPAVELDVRLTRDHVPVVVHDDNLARLTGANENVSELTWDELSHLRIRRELPIGFDTYGSPKIVRYDKPEPIPQLTEVLAEVGRKVLINIELKLDFPKWWHVEIGAVVARVIGDAMLEDRVIITSFDPRKLRAAGRVSHRLALGFCFDDGMLNWARGVLDRLPFLRSDHGTEDRRPGHNARSLLTRLLDTDLAGFLLGTRVVGAEHTLVGPKTVQRLHRLGVAIGTHTLFPLGASTSKRISPAATSTAEVDRLVALGVDWIETDDPERLMRLVG